MRGGFPRSTDGATSLFCLRQQRNSEPSQPTPIPQCRAIECPPKWAHVAGWELRRSRRPCPLSGARAGQTTPAWQDARQEGWTWESNSSIWQCRLGAPFAASSSTEHPVRIGTAP
eukprot:3243680-Alexandrium_andersonii.AAC.1